MPECTSCAYAVDWLRSCYYSTRRLFFNRPDITTRGAYYRLDAKAPHFPFPNTLGSLNYCRQELDGTQPVVGELVDAPRPWYNGALPAEAPRARMFGDPACFTQGERWPLPVIPGRQSIYGFDSRCFSRIFGNAPAVVDDWDVQNRCLLLVVAQVLEWLYSGPELIEPMLRVWFGDGPTITVVRNNDTLFPGFALVETETYILACVYGTSNFQQLSLQATTTIMELWDTAEYGTTAVWYIATNTLLTRIEAIVTDVTKPIVLAGHSYGGVICTLLTARFLRNQPDREMRLITFGCPKPGDARVKEALGGVPRIHVCTDNDPVPSLPPDIDILATWLPFVPDGLLAQWRRFSRLNEQYILAIDGGLFPSNENTLDWPTLSIIMGDILTAQTIDPIEGHYLNNYVIRLRAGCPAGGAFPVPVVVRNMLVDAPFPAPRGGDVDDGIAAIAAAGELLAAGGDVDDGIAEFPSAQTITAAGGDVDDGIATGLADKVTAWMNCASGTNDSSTGATLWTSPGNITVCDGTNAQSALLTGAPTSQLLTATDFGFSVVSSFPMKGIEVRMNRRASNINTISDLQVTLTLGGSQVGTDHSAGGFWPVVLTQISYGGDTDSWGPAFSDADVNDPSFGFVLQIQRTAGVGIRIGFVDCVEMRVFYPSDF